MYVYSLVVKFVKYFNKWVYLMKDMSAPIPYQIWASCRQESDRY